MINFRGQVLKGSKWSESLSKSLMSSE